MTGRERVRKAVKHEVTDRIPVDYCVRDDVSEALQKYLGLPDLESVYKKLGIDVRKFFIQVNVPSFLARSGGKKIIRYPDGRIENAWGVVQRPSNDGRYFEMVTGPFYENENIDSFDWPGLECIESEESIRKKIDSFGGEYSTFGWVDNPFKLCWFMRGFENYLCDTVANEDFAITLWEKLAEYELEKGIRFIRAGIDTLMVVGDIAMQDRMIVSPATWRKIDKPRLAEMLKTWKGLNPEIMFYFHSDGNMEEVLPDLIEIGFDMVNPIQPECMDVVYIKKKYGRDFTLHGTISIQKTLPFGTIDDVHNETLSRIGLGKDDGGIIIVPSNYVQSDTPLENLIEIYRTVGSYQE